MREQVTRRCGAIQVLLAMPVFFVLNCGVCPPVHEGVVLEQIEQYYAAGFGRVHLMQVHAYTIAGLELVTVLMLSVWQMTVEWVRLP